MKNWILDIKRNLSYRQLLDQFGVNFRHVQFFVPGGPTPKPDNNGLYIINRIVEIKNMSLTINCDLENDGIEDELLLQSKQLQQYGLNYYIIKKINFWCYMMIKIYLVC